MRPSLNLLMERAKFTNGEILGCLESCVIIIDLIRHINLLIAFQKLWTSL